MTIGIAISGPGAVACALAALRAVEAVGRGAIGGFVSLVAISNGQLLDASVQDGGSEALLGGGLPEAFNDARLAALMSSGPNRPEPLIQFTPGDAEVGLITGHRLPNMPGPAGIPPNIVALEAMRRGATAAEAVGRALHSAPDADAGLIGLELGGNIGIANSRSVARRDDLGGVVHSDPITGLRIGVLHNSIFPHRVLAELAVVAAVDYAAPEDAFTAQARIVGHSVTVGSTRALDVDASGEIVGITVSEPIWLSPSWEGSPVERGDPVMFGGREIGRVVREVYCRLEEGRIVGTRGGGDYVAWRSRG